MSKHEGELWEYYAKESLDLEIQLIITVPLVILQ
jgi:hypothetical protein